MRGPGTKETPFISEGCVGAKQWINPRLNHNPAQVGRKPRRVGNDAKSACSARAGFEPRAPSNLLVPFVSMR